MAELKTKPTDASVAKFLDAIPDEQRRRDCYTILELMRKATRAEPKMWGSSIVGFGNYHYVYASGREGDWFLVGFSPHKRDLTIYLMCGVSQNAALLKKLGKHKIDKACLYVKKLEDIDLPTLRKLVAESVKQARQVKQK